MKIQPFSISDKAVVNNHLFLDDLVLTACRYCAGTMPWGNPGEHHDFEPQRHDDGYIEVIGFTMTSLAALQVGGHGERLHQCREVVLTTFKSVPMQVDGEPCRLSPSIIHITLRNQANMVQKAKRRASVPHLNDSQAILEQLKVQVSRISMHDYEALHYDKEKLREASVPLGVIMVPGDCDLELCRAHIERLQEQEEESGRPRILSSQRLSPKWCFLDSTSADRFFRIDRAQEHLHCLIDISMDELFVMDPELQTSNESFSPSMALPMVPEAPLGPVVELSVNKTCKNIPSDSPALSSVARTDVPSVAKKRLGRMHSSFFRKRFSSDGCMTETLARAQAQLGLQRATPSPLARPNRLDAPDNSKDKVPQKQNENDTSSSSRPRIMFALDSKEGLLDAATSGDYEKFVQLHRDGCNLLSTDEDGCTALHHAATEGHPQLVEFILREAPPELMDMTERHRGETALHRAASNSHPDTCHILIEKGASLEKTDSQGDTALDKAHEAGNHELAAYLEAQQQHQSVTRDDQETAV
uniref:Diacylglycerol kinase accessory domain-containing protein n=1 Tax=Eptatretus burgeri TaxID=7764 RepID=A0A8C4QT23_EPTBU